MDHQTAPKLPTRLKLYKYEIERLAVRNGLSFWEIKYEMVSAEEMSEVVARNGFPVMPAHWETGMKSIMNKKKFRYGMGRVFEIVIRIRPVIGFLLDSNHAYDNIAVMAHVCGHADLFLNNQYAQFADTNMDQVFASDAAMLDAFCRQYGEERVKMFFDTVLSLQNLIDANSLYIKRPEQRVSTEEYERRRKERQQRLHELLPEGFPKELESMPHIRELKKEAEQRLAEEEQRDRELLSGMKVPAHPTKDVLQFLIDHAPLEPWQRSLLEMVRRSRYYFSQFRCKFLHEGWASLQEELLMHEVKLDKDLTRWTSTLAQVQRKKGMNPYRLTYDLLLDVRHRYDTGRHGGIWENCVHYEVKRHWDTFIVYHNLRVECGDDSALFLGRWREFSQFLHELREGRLAYPKELFVNDRFLGQYLHLHWTEYAHAEGALAKYEAMLVRIEARGLEAEIPKEIARLRTELSSADLTDRELSFKARRDIYFAAGERELYRWTPDEIREKIAYFRALVNFKERYKKEGASVPALSIPEDWVAYSLSYKEAVPLAKGKSKWFELRKTHDDFSMFDDFFTKEFCEQEGYFLYKAKEVLHGWSVEKRFVIETKAFERIKKYLLFQFTDFYTPFIEVVDGDYGGNGDLLLRHAHNGVDIDWWSKDGMFVKDVLLCLAQIWKKTVHLETIQTDEPDEVPFWYRWFKTEEKTTPDEPEQLGGVKVRFSMAPDGKFSGEKGDAVIFPVPF